MMRKEAKPVRRKVRLGPWGHPYPAVVVTWHDATTEKYQSRRESISDPLPVLHSIGFLIGEDKVNIALADAVHDKWDRYESDAIDAYVTKIPVSQVRRVRRLR